MQQFHSRAVAFAAALALAQLPGAHDLEHL
jgi:hypothetical protein